MKPGFVYIAVRTDGVFKIGASIAPESRMKSLGQLSPGIKLVHAIESADHKRVEDWIHTAFAHRLIRYEWYALDLFDVEFLRRVVNIDSVSEAPPWLAELHRLNGAGELLMPFADANADLPQARVNRTGWTRVEIEMDADIFAGMDELRRKHGRTLSEEMRLAIRRHMDSPPPVPPPPPVVPPPVKRGRGRPRKNPLPEKGWKVSPFPMCVNYFAILC